MIVKSVTDENVCSLLPTSCHVMKIQRNKPIVGNSELSMISMTHETIEELTTEMQSTFFSVDLH